MNQILRHDADQIIRECIRAVQADEAVQRALAGREFSSGRVRLVATGKAAWNMANAAAGILGNRLECGIVVTKYDHVQGEIPRVTCIEAGHPIPDENSFRGTQAALDIIANLTADDTVLFLVSGGGSALFEKPLIPAAELQDLTRNMLACGANIVEMNIIRKRMSAVKGGKFALACQPAKVFCIVLSDILGDPLDMIASGPAYPDSATSEDAKRVVEKYKLKLSHAAMSRLEEETPKVLNNVETCVTGSVRELCQSVAKTCRQLGYEPVILTDHLDCVAREAGAFLADIGRTHARDNKSKAYIAGGETVVHLTGTGKGGRNQELALAAAVGVAGIHNAAVFSMGSDGTDGPTDAAGGYVDGDTMAQLSAHGLAIYNVLQNNDAYHALQHTGGLIFTGATGTNVNDVAVLLLRGSEP